jgi:hypothetical protein
MWQHRHKERADHEGERRRGIIGVPAMRWLHEVLLSADRFGAAPPGQADRARHRESEQAMIEELTIEQARSQMRLVLIPESMELVCRSCGNADHGWMATWRDDQRLLGYRCMACNTRHRFVRGDEA